MKTFSRLILTGALALGFGTATGFAGDRVIKTEGRAGYRSAERQARETTVAIYTEERREIERATQPERDPRSVIVTQGRAGYRRVSVD